MPPALAALVWPPEQAPPDGAGVDATWNYAWPAGERLASLLGGLCQPAGRRVLDLGCGRGHLGLCALLAGAAQVVFADAAPPALDRLRRVLAANRLDDRGALVEHRWGPPLPGPAFDLILAGDLLYRPAAFPDLLATIAGSLAGDGEALLSDPRERLEAELPALAAAAGLTWDPVRIRPGLTLARARRVRS